MVAIQRYLVDLERIVNRTETDRHLLMKTNKAFHSFSSQTTTRGGRSIGMLLTTIPLVHLGFVFNFEKILLKYCSRVVSGPVSIISKLRRT